MVGVNTCKSGDCLSSRERLESENAVRVALRIIITYDVGQSLLVWRPAKYHTRFS